MREETSALLEVKEVSNCSSRGVFVHNIVRDWYAHLPHLRAAHAVLEVSRAKGMCFEVRQHVLNLHPPQTWGRGGGKTGE